MMKLQCLILILAACSSAGAAAPTADPEKSASEMITPAAQRGIDQGLQWLSSRQNDDGSFGAGAVARIDQHLSEQVNVDSSG